jgi:hypothetical protein
MPVSQRTCRVSHWPEPDQTACEITVWPVYDAASTTYPELIGRASIALNIGAASVSLRPTADEAREIIRALEWALATAREASPEALAA